MAKIYTKKGDKGFTQLLGGTKVPKNHIRIQAFGSVDELNSYIGLLHAYTINAPHKDLLIQVQVLLFNMGSWLAADAEGEKFPLPKVTQADVEAVEKAIDQMQEELTPLKNFILPGGHKEVAMCHIARTVARRAERDVVALNENEPVDPIHLVYLNRLSDYLFVLARWMSKAMDVEEILWKP